MDPLTLGIGGGLSLAGMVYSGIKGGQANRQNKAILDKQEAENQAWYNNNRNYFDTVQGKSAIEQVREAMQNRTRQDANTAVVTGATAETEIAQKEAANKGYADTIRQIATQGSEYASRNEGIYRNNLNNIYAQRMGQNNMKMQNAANLSGNMGNLFSSAAYAGVFDKQTPAAP